MKENTQTIIELLVNKNKEIEIKKRALISGKNYDEMTELQLKEYEGLENRLADNEEIIVLYLQERLTYLDDKIDRLNKGMI
jgi:hypothetical protein